MLGNTKAKAAEVSAKLIAADETKANINEKREQFRAAATRGSVLYFAIVEMSAVSPMYQTSLFQFLELFMKSMDRAEKAALASKRVANIIETMTYTLYRYVNRGLYEKDKLSFILICLLKILQTAGHLTPAEVTVLLKGGAALDINSVRGKPFAWITDAAWLNTVQLSKENQIMKQLPDELIRNEAAWRAWYTENEPETVSVPHFETRFHRHRRRRRVLPHAARALAALRDRKSVV